MTYACMISWHFHIQCTCNHGISQIYSIWLDNGVALIIGKATPTDIDLFDILPILELICFFCTYRTAPEGLSVPTAVSLTSTSVLLTWEPPATINGMINLLLLGWPAAPPLFKMFWLYLWCSHKFCSTHYSTSKLTHLIPLHKVNFAHLGLGPLFKFKLIVY